MTDAPRRTIDEEQRAELDAVFERARKALAILETYDQARVDRLCQAVAWAVANKRTFARLVDMGIEESGLGDAESRMGKRMKIRGVLRDALRQKSVGIIEELPDRGLVKYGKPAGIVACIVPTTNPDLTPAGNAIYGIKARDVVIFSPHPRSKKTSFETVRLMREALEREGAPPDILQCLVKVNIPMSQALMARADLVIATGGQAMVQSAYSSGTPAYGVGAGNSTMIIDETADIAEAARNTRLSKTSDFGSGCSADGNLVIEATIFGAMVEQLKKEGGYFAGETEKVALCKAMWDEAGHRRPDTVAIAPQKLAAAAGFTIPADRRFIMVRGDGIGKDHPFSSEKLTTLLALYSYRGFDEALAMMRAIYDVGGKGHSCGIYSFDPAHIHALALAAPVSRIMVRQPQSKANAGAFNNGMPMTSSLGCGTWGGNVVSENVHLKHYMNTTWVSVPIKEDRPPDEELFGPFYDAALEADPGSEGDVKKLISHQLVKYLEARGVAHVFGLCGHTNIAVLAEIEKSRIKFVNVRHEQIAAHMADGYARVTKKASVVLSHLGPGLTNACTGVANAALDSTPMVVIAGDVPTHYHGKHPHQEVNLHADASQHEIYRPFAKRTWRVDQPDLFPEIIEKAFALAESGRPGAVLVDVPMDIFSKEIDVGLFERLQTNAKTLRKPSLDEDTAEEIVKRLMEAKRPILYVGGGIMLADATAELRALVDHLQIPVAHTLMGKGAVPDDHPFVLGMTGFWGTRFINEQCRGADLVLGLGTRFSEADCSSWETEYTFAIPPTKLIHIDIDPAEIGRNFPVEIGAVADLKQALAALTRAARRLAPQGVKRPVLATEIAAVRAAFIEGNRKHAESDAFPMRPERILADVRRALPRDAFITTDVGWNKNGVGQQFPILEPGTIFTPGGLATMGFGAPAALGAKLASPKRTVVALVGDGGFGQNPAMLATAFEQDIAVVWIIMNNFAYGTIAGLEKAHFGTTFGTVFEKNGKPYSPDYAAIAKAYGVDGLKVGTAAEFGPALERAIKSGKPFVLDVAMQNEPVPTAGHWNIMDIYSPGKKVHHASTVGAVPGD